MKPLAEISGSFGGSSGFRDMVGWLACVFVVLILVHLNKFQSAELMLLDWQIDQLRSAAPKPATSDVVIVSFDEKFLESAQEPFALFHPHLAKVLDAMRLAKPTLVAFDIALPEKSFYGVVPRGKPEYDYDKELLKAIVISAREFPIILAHTVDRTGRKLREIQASFMAAANRSPLLPEGISASASAILCTDQDDRVRRFPEPICTGVQSVPPLAAVMAIVQGNRNGSAGLINYSIGAPFSVITASDVMSANERGDFSWLESHFRGKAVLVGVILRDEDRHALPVALSLDEPLNLRVPGVMVHAQLYRSLMNNGLITVANVWLTMLVVTLGALFWMGVSSRKKVIVVIVFSVCVIGISAWLLHQGTYLPVAGVVLAAWFSCSSKAAFDSALAWRERRHLRSAFGGSVSPQLMRRMESGEISPAKQGKRTNVCVLFCDVRGFTTLSERLPPERVVEILNRYFSAMTATIHRHGGVVDKFMGDGIMVLFGEPAPLPEPEKAALDAAHEMLIKVDELNIGSFQSEGIKLEIGIGIHCGDAIVGFIGSHERHEFTAIGDTVNTAARLEGLSKSLGYPIICSESIALVLGHPEFLIPLGEQPIKGRAAISTFGWNPVSTA